MAAQSKLFIELGKDAGRNGLALGRAGAMVLRRRIALHQRQLKSLPAEKIPTRLIRARLRDFKRNLRLAAPHWLAEAQGMARGAGVAADDILMLNCPPPDAPPPDAGMNCTTWLSIGGASNRLLKIRDERNRIQTFYITPLDDDTPLQTAKDIGNLGAAHFFSGRPLAGANNTGSNVNLPDAPCLNDCHILRFLAENARGTKDIPRLMDFLMSKKLAGGASRERGAIYTFIDDEQGLHLETGAGDFTWQFITSGDRVISNHFLLPAAKRWMTRPANANTLTRKARMEELLARLKRPPTARDLFAITRDRKHAPDALCNDDKVHFWMTISAQLHVINRARPAESLNYVCCGNTRHSVYMPIPLTCTQSFIPLVSGRFYMQADRLYHTHACRAHMAAAQRHYESRHAALPPDGNAAPALIEAHRLLSRER